MLRSVMKCVFLCLSSCLLISQNVYSQSAANYPNKQVTFVLTQAPGGANDITGRAIAQKLTDMLKVPFIVDNRPGAGDDRHALLK